MQVVNGGQSFWIYTLLFTSLPLWRTLSASTSSPSLPAPELSIRVRSEDTVVLVCKVPQGQHGVLFMLYQYEQKVDSQELQFGAAEVRFSVRITDADSVQQKLFCCLYKSRDGRYSAFSPYVQLERQGDTIPPPPTPTFPAPALSVQPSTGVVKHGDMLSFQCSVPLLPPQPLHQSSYYNEPLTFLLLRTGKGTGVASTIQMPPAGLVSSPQPGVFSVVPVRGRDEGEYACLYQIRNKERLVNSTVSNTVHITITDTMPTPTLVLQQHTDVWHVLCTGSPAYPGAVFSLYLVDVELPVVTHSASMIHHQATFPLPVQDTPVASYQCQYSVLLGNEWSDSDRSLPLVIVRGSSPPAPSDGFGVDWPLVLGSLSAMLLFLCSVVIVAVVVQRKAKEAAKEKKKRRDATFWNQIHVKDHVVDPPLRHTSVTAQEWTSDTTTETASRSPLWNSLNTFTAPIHSIH